MITKQLKNGIGCILFFWTIASWGQGQLTGVTTTVNMLGPTIQITQEFALDLPDSIHRVTLKALNFKGTTLSNINVKANQEMATVKEAGAEQLKQFTVTGQDGVPLKNVMLSYTIAADHSNFYVPLFFTNLPAAHSDIDFFKGSLYLYVNTDYRILFPKVSLNEFPDNAIKEVVFELPALPSMIRLQIDPKDTLDFWEGNRVDMLVALLFIGIGFLIWKNRKRLAYG